MMLNRNDIDLLLLFMIIGTKVFGFSPLSIILILGLASIDALYWIRGIPLYF